MKQKVIIFVLVLVSLLLFDFALAQCPPGTNPDGNGLCFPDTDLPDPAPGGDGVGLVIGRVMQWLLGLLAAFGIIGFVISGMQYLLSAGDDKVMGTAKRNMVYCIVGVVVGLSGYVVIMAIDNALDATSTAF